MVAASSAKKTVKVGLASTFRFRNSRNGAAQGQQVHENLKCAPQHHENAYEKQLNHEPQHVHENRNVHEKQLNHEDLKVFDIVAGKFVNLHPATASMIITVFALLAIISLVGTRYAMSLSLLLVGILSLVFQEGQVEHWFNYFFSAARRGLCSKRSAGDKLAQAFDLTNPEKLKEDQGLLDELWKTYDKNGDGDLTLEECTALMQDYIEAKVRDLETDKAKAPFERLAKGRERAAKTLRNTIDKDGDGKITKEEFMNKFPEALKLAIEGPPSGCSIL